MSVTQSPETPATQKTKRKARKEARARANWLAHWKKLYSKYHLTESDLKICDDVRRQFKLAPLPQRTRLLSKAVTDVVEGYRVQHKLAEVDAFMQERIDKAVRKWIRERTRSRVRAAKIGTKAYTTRQVFYQQNKERVKKRAAKLDGTNIPSIGASAIALAQLYQDLPQEEMTNPWFC